MACERHVWPPLHPHFNPLGRISLEPKGDPSIGMDFRREEGGLGSRGGEKDDCGEQSHRMPVYAQWRPGLGAEAVGRLLCSVCAVGGQIESYIVHKSIASPPNLVCVDPGILPGP